MKAFWIDSIRLDEDQDVTGVTAVVDAPYLEHVDRLVHGGGVDRQVAVTRVERGGTEAWVELDVQQLMALFREVGNRVDADPLQIPGCYDRLTQVVYGLMDDD